MKLKSIKCSAQDYDFYTIAFPLKALFKNKRNRYISSQLEKLHPCFSQAWAFDSHLRLSKAGLKADVVVMQNYKLAEYKSNKKRLIFAERKSRAFFTGRQTWLRAFILPVPVFFLLLLVLFIVIRPEPSSKESASTKTEPAIQSSLSDSQEHEKKYLAADLLSAILELGGSIQNFSWSYDGFNENLSLLLYKLYPEDLSDFSSKVKFSSLAFKDSMPSMTINFSRHYVQSQNNFITDYSQIKKDLRKIIQNNNIELIEESTNPYGIKIRLLQNQRADLLKLLDYFISSELSLSAIKINNSSGFINADFVFAQRKFDDMTDFYQKLIKVQNQQQGESQKNIELPLQKEQSQNPQGFSTKIGQIIKPDGSVISYYKDEKGKIIWR